MLRRPNPGSPGVFAVALALLGCGGGVAGGTSGSDGGTRDGAPPDSALTDSSPADSAPSDDAPSSPADAMASPDATEAGSTGAPDGSASCKFTSTSTLAGVTMSFGASVCTFTVAQAQAGITIPYVVTVSGDVSGVVPATQDAGRCQAPGPSQIIVFESLGGGAQSYCLCDVGLCPSVVPPPVTLHAGQYTSDFHWQGRNWAGPSDTGNPMGAPFPPGVYTLRISAKGTQNGTSFDVESTMDITLTP